jgi:hypothetical protein
MEFRKKVRGPGHRPSTPKRHGPSIIIAPGRKEPPTAPKPVKNDSEPFDLPSPQVVIIQLLGILLVLLVWGLGQLVMPTAEGASPTNPANTTLEARFGELLLVTRTQRGIGRLSEFPKKDG